MSRPSKTTDPLVGSVEPRDEARGRRLAAAGLADEAEGLTLAQGGS